MLVAAGVPAEAATKLAHGRPLDAPDRRGVYRSSPSAPELFQAASSIARRERRQFAGAHVLLAAADLEHGTLARAFDRLDVGRDSLRTAAREALEGR